MGKTTPKISIIIPSYNSGKYLPYTLKSIEEQNYSNYEVILVDGESTDETADVVKQYNHVITTFISEKDEGQSDAVNKGLSYATGEFVLWQNADDIFFPNAFSAFINVINNKESYDVYFGDIALLAMDGRQLWKRYFTDIDSLIANYHGLICYNQAAFIRRKVLDRYGFLDKSYHYSMDREFFLRLYHNRVRFKHFDQVIAGFRHQPESKTETPENVEKWVFEHKRIAQQYHLFPPESTMNVLLEKLGSVDKALRMLLSNPDRFAATVKRTIFASNKRPY